MDPLHHSFVPYLSCALICLAVKKGLSRILKSSSTANHLNPILRKFNPIDQKKFHYLCHFKMALEAFLNCANCLHPCEKTFIVSSDTNRRGLHSSGVLVNKNF